MVSFVGSDLEYRPLLSFFLQCGNLGVLRCTSSVRTSIQIQQETREFIHYRFPQLYLAGILQEQHPFR